MSAPIVISAEDGDANYASLAAANLQTFIRVSGDINRYSGTSWGSSKQGGSSGTYLTGHFTGSQDPQTGIQSVYAHATGGTYDNFWSPTGFWSSGDLFDATQSDTVMPLGGSLILGGPEKGLSLDELGAGPLIVPPPSPPQFVIGYDYRAFDVQSYSNGSWSNPGSHGYYQSQGDLNVWDSATNLGVRMSDGSVIQLSTLSESTGFSLTQKTDSSSTGADGTFNFGHVDVKATGYESSNFGPVADAGLASAVNAALYGMDRANYDPMGAAVATSHGASSPFTGNSGSLVEVMASHVMGVGKG